MFLFRLCYPLWRNIFLSYFSMILLAWDFLNFPLSFIYDSKSNICPTCCIYILLVYQCRLCHFLHQFVNMPWPEFEKKLHSLIELRLHCESLHCVIACAQYNNFICRNARCGSLQLAPMPVSCEVLLCSFAAQSADHTAGAARCHKQTFTDVDYR